VTGLQRHKPMKRSKLLARTALSRGKPLTRKGRVKPRNAKRKAEQFARNFGDEAEAVRALPCLCRGRGPLVRCLGAVAAAHVKSRGASGGRFDLVPMCRAHHDEQHAAGVETFAASYGLDLRAEADRVALGHAAPLGICGLAVRWLGCPGGYTCEGGMTVDQADRPISIKCPDCNGSPPKAPDAYEREALLGWARRAMGRMLPQWGCSRCGATWHDDGQPPSGLEGFECPDCSGRIRKAAKVDREALARGLAQVLGEPFTSDAAGEHGLAWSLCEVAGWPS
jgi:DNA-directed RNA polymerase subunit RPC12/RpoP